MKVQPHIKLFPPKENVSLPSDTHEKFDNIMKCIIKMLADNAAEKFRQDPEAVDDLGPPHIFTVLRGLPIDYTAYVEEMLDKQSAILVKRGESKSCKGAKAPRRSSDRSTVLGLIYMVKVESRKLVLHGIEFTFKEHVIKYLGREIRIIRDVYIMVSIVLESIMKEIASAAFQIAKTSRGELVKLPKYIKITVNMLAEGVKNTPWESFVDLPQ